MSKFLTEKQIEAYLEPETRELPLPDGSVQVVTGMKLLWQSVDCIVDTYTYTLAELVELTQKNQMKQNISFEESFSRVVSYIHRRMRGE